MTTSLKPRVPGGVRAGGEFTNRERRDGSLGSSVFVAVNGSDEITASDAIRVAQYYAAKPGGRKTVLTKIDHEDIVQEVMEEMLRRYGHFTPGLIKAAIGTAKARTLLARDGIRSEEARARRKLDEAIDMHAQVMGRLPSDVEVDKLAEGIRDNWPDQRHKPSSGFHRPSPKKEILVDPDVFDRMPAAEPTPASSMSVQDLDAAVTANTITKAQARRMFWNAYAGEQDLPRVVPGSINAQTGRRLRQFDVDAAAQQYLTIGFADADLFLPFGDCSADQQRDLASELRGPRGTALWLAAVEAAAAP